MGKIFLFLFLSLSVAFASINFQSASKDQLMAISGIGEKKAEAIMEYRKKNKIKSVDDLKNIKGFGSKMIEKIKMADKLIK